MRLEARISIEHSRMNGQAPPSPHTVNACVSGTKLEPSSYIHGSTYIRTKLFWHQRSAMTERTILQSQAANNANVTGPEQ
jgi:hypothetical protein